MLTPEQEQKYLHDQEKNNWWENRKKKLTAQANKVETDGCVIGNKL